MTKEQREELLTDLSKTSQADALKEYLQEEIDKIKNINNIESFEEMIGRKYAAKTLEETIRYIESLKEEKKTGSNQYV